MKARIKQVLLRARYAAMGAAAGAAIGSIISRNAASTGAALGALVGMTVADTRGTATTFLEEAKTKEIGPLSSGDGDSDQR